MSFRNLSVADADAQTRAGAITLIDVRPPEERAIAAVPVMRAMARNLPESAKARVEVGDS